MFEENDIVKLMNLNTGNYVYVALLKINDKICKVKCLQKPLYDLINFKYAEYIFESYNDDENKESVELNYIVDKNIFNVSVDMISNVDKFELIDIMKKLIYVDFMTSHQNKLIYSTALDKLKYMR